MRKHSLTRDDRGASTLGTLAILLVLGALLCYLSGMTPIDAYYDVKRKVPFLAPSAAEYCESFKKYGDEMHAKWASYTRATNNDPFAAMALTLGSFGDLKTFFGNLSEHTPDDIYDDVKRLEDISDQMDKNYGSSGLDILSTGFNGLTLAMQASAPSMRVDQYTTKNCPPPIGLKGANQLGIAGGDTAQ